MITPREKSDQVAGPNLPADLEEEVDSDDAQNERAQGRHDEPTAESGHQRHVVRLREDEESQDHVNGTADDEERRQINPTSDQNDLPEGTPTKARGFQPRVGGRDGDPEADPHHEHLHLHPRPRDVISEHAWLKAIGQAPERYDVIQVDRGA